LFTLVHASNPDGGEEIEDLALCAWTFCRSGTAGTGAVRLTVRLESAKSLVFMRLGTVVRLKRYCVSPSAERLDFEVWRFSDVWILALGALLALLSRPYVRSQSGFVTHQTAPTRIIPRQSEPIRTRILFRHSFGQSGPGSAFRSLRVSMGQSNQSPSQSSLVKVSQG